MLRKIILGELRASNPENQPGTEDSNWNWTRIYHILCNTKNLRSVINYDREWYGKESVWSQKGFMPTASGMAFNSPSPAWGDRQEFLHFLKVLKEFLQTEEAVKLGLEGSLQITQETPNLPIVIRVKIKDGKVSYQEAETVEWGEEVTA